MRCARARRLMGRYIDKELMDKRTVDFIEDHLKECHLCRAELGSLLEVKGLISEKQKLAAKDDFLARLKEGLNPPTSAVELKWVIETGKLARRLIPVPVTVMLLAVLLLFARHNGLDSIDDYILADLNSRERAIASGDIEDTDLLKGLLLEGYPLAEG